MHLQDCSRISVQGRHVIIVEDIVDTGGTLDKLIKRIVDNGAASVKVAALLNKLARRTVEVPVHFEGFKCEDSFVIGCACTLRLHHLLLVWTMIRRHTAQQTHILLAAVQVWDGL